MRTSPSWLAIVAVNLLLPIGILIFAKGFFPYKPFLPGLATFDADAPPVPAPFNKLVFMVVDALRSDFVYSGTSGFKFTQSLVANGYAQPFTAHATSPTITMPRVKAITTGSVPGFLDVILNFAESDTSSTLAQTDTWLAQINARGDNLVMYGDDTWLKLFPGIFKRSDGTSSFFVSDFTEVDNNVTRHIDDELKREDWSVMVMHYLGLDHIGHKTGPRSSFMIPKQEEMDGIVERIYTAILSYPHLESTVFVLLGDHGMNDAGNHGGSGPGETSPALVLMSPKLKKLSPNGFESPTVPKDDEGFEFYSKIEQSDIAPSLSGLLGVPIPKNNLGVFIPQLLNMWDVNDRMELLMGNAKQLLAIALAAYPDFEQSSFMGDCSSAISDVVEIACHWNNAKLAYESWKANQGTADDDVLQLLLKFLYECQSTLSGAASNYDLNLMALGIAVMAGASIAGAVMVVPHMGASFLVDFAYPAMTISYGSMMFASSYVEEEHHFWYWVATGWFVLLFLKQQRLGANGGGALMILALLRIVRRWNQTGQKFAGAPDIARSYFPEHTTLLWALVISTYMDIFVRLLRRAFRREGATVFAFTVATAAFCFKLSFTAQDAPELIPSGLQPLINALQELPLVTQARTAFLAILGGIVYTFVELNRDSGDNAQNAASVFGFFVDLFLMTQTRVANIPLFLLFRLITKSLNSLRSLSAPEITVTILVLQHFTYFAFGGTNAISSVDLSNSYNGVSGYNVLVVGALTFVSNWIGPIFWTSLAPLLFAMHTPGDKEAWKRYIIMMTAFYAITAAFIMGACMSLRTHLFIWTVFSPKYLYSMVWTVLFQIGINLGWGSAMHWAAGKKVI